MNKILGIIINTVAVIAMLFICTLLFQKLKKSPSFQEAVEEVKLEYVTPSQSKVEEQQEPKQEKRSNSFLQVFDNVYNAVTNKKEEKPVEPIVENKPVEPVKKKSYAEKFFGDSVLDDPIFPKEGETWFNAKEQIGKKYAGGEIHCFVFADRYDRMAKIATPYFDLIPNRLYENSLWLDLSHNNLLKKWHNGRMEIVHKIIP